MEYLEMIKESRLQDYHMQAIIASNPHTKKPQELFKLLDKELRAFHGDGIMGDEEPEVGAFDKLRSILNRKTKT